MSKTTITSRTGNFTSSQIYRIMGTPAVLKTYLEEKKYEIKLGRQLDQDKGSPASMWGNYIQHRVTNVLLDTGCKPTKDERRQHTLIYNWTGAEDYLRENSIGEIKCFELRKFCKAHDAATKGWDELKKACPDIAWQLVSNSILNQKISAELALYVPYQKELAVIRDKDEWQRILPPMYFEKKEFQYWINSLQYREDDELPYLLEGKHYKNLTIFQFDISDADRDELTNKVVESNKLLNQLKKSQNKEE